jgi:hypothetical protein
MWVTTESGFSDDGTLARDHAVTSGGGSEQRWNLFMSHGV